METILLDNNLKNGLTALNSTPENALKEFIILNLSDKISKFKSEVELYEKKYKMDFNAFEKIIETRSNEENFEEYDDYMAWKFAREQIVYLSNQFPL